MSNGPQEHNPNRNRNNNRNRNRNRNGENRSNDNRNNENRNRTQGNNPNKPRGVSQHESFVNRAPAKKLSLWDKIKKMFGLYKEPTKPARSDTRPKRDESKPTTPRPPRSENQAPRSNTRDARSATGDARPPREPREPRAPREPRERREPSLADVESTRLYIGNLSYDASESDIEELFKGVGPVRRVEIVYNKHTHKSKGYGFVEMLRIDEAKRAVEVLHDQHFMGRQLIVSGAKAKNAEEGEAAVAAREDKEQAKEQAAAEARAATAVATSAAAVVAVAEVTEQVAPAIEEVEVATVTETSAVIEEVHSLEGEAQKETFV